MAEAHSQIAMKAAEDANAKLNKICSAAHFPELTYAEKIRWDFDPECGEWEQPTRFIVGDRKFGYYEHVVGGHKDALEGAKQAVLMLLAPKILSQMAGWFSDGSIQALMTKNGEQAEYHRIMNAANAILRGLDI